MQMTMQVSDRASKTDVTVAVDVPGADQGCQQVTLAGRLDVGTVAGVRDVLHQALSTGTGDLVVDVHDLEIVDATGLGVLLGAHHRARLLDRRLVLHGASPRVRRILRVTRLHRVLSIDDPIPAPR